jgi:hypothetical protein
VTAYFSPGTTAVVRSIVRGAVGHVRTTTVIQDTEELLALYVQPGHLCKRRAGVRGGPRGRNVIAATGGHEDWTWFDNRALMIYRPGDAHSVHLFRRAEDDELFQWYIDLHEPFRRASIGFDSRDLMLDIVVEPDMSSWRWKDEDEFAWFQETGRITLAQASAVRADGLRAVERLIGEDRESYRRWVDWRPDPGWTIPSLPEGWDVA